MQIRNAAIVSALALPFFLGSFGGSSLANARPLPSMMAAAQDYGGHDAYRDARERGRSDGARAAYHDIQRGLAPDPARHHEFRNPPVDHHFDHAYRDGFRHGYRDVYHHNHGR